MNGHIKFGARLAILAGLLLAGVATGCTDNNTATRVLVENGYKNIAITGYSPFTCAKDDDFATGFQATSPGGVKVIGAVCSSWLTKGATIRFK